MVAARFGDQRTGFQRLRNSGRKSIARRVGLKGPLSCLNQARYGIGWGALGAAMACYDTALQYAKTRKQFANKPIASHQLVQEKLAWMITEIVKGQLLALHVGRFKDDGKVDPSHISMLKMNNVAIALDIARKVARHSRRQRHRGRLLHHAPHEQSRKRVHLRRHQRYSQTGDRRKNHRHRRLCVGTKGGFESPALHFPCNPHPVCRIL